MPPDVTETAEEPLRLLSGLIVAGLLASAVLFLNTPGVALLFAVIALALGWEWGRLIARFPDAPDAPDVLLRKAESALNAHKLYSAGRRIWRGMRTQVPAIWLLWLAVLIVLFWFVRHQAALFVLYAAAVWWALMFMLIAAYRPGYLDSDWLGWMFRIGFPVVPVSAWLAVILLHQQGDLLYLLALVAVVDAAAYYSGRRWGDRKLIPELSPGKSYAGLWGALAAALVLSAAVGFFSHADWRNVLNFVLLSLFIALVCIIGDLAESMLKRRARVKDSGSCLPGHGGLLDRADSFLAASVAFAVIQY